MTAHPPVTASRCPVPDCGRTVKRNRFLCGVHWPLVPIELRSRMLRAWAQFLHEDAPWEPFQAARDEALEALR